jgi:hypothetical protein
MLIPIILALTFLITSTTISKDKPVVYDLTTKEIYDANKRGAGRDSK